MLTAMPDRPALTAARWIIDPDHSHVGVAVRRRGLAPFQARFTSVSGHLDTSDDQPRSTLELVVETASIVPGSAGCDLRAAEHLDVARHPTATFRATSTGWTRGLARFRGWLTIVGVTNEVTIEVEHRDSVVDSSGTRRSAFSGAASIDREAWGLSWNVTLADGRALVERIVDLELVLETVLHSAPSAPSTSADTGRH